MRRIAVLVALALLLAVQPAPAQAQLADNPTGGSAQQDVPGPEPLWVARYNGPGNGTDRAKAIALDGQGNVYVTGYSDDILIGWDYATVKYDAQGGQTWVSRYNGPGNSHDFATAIAVDEQGNVYVTGLSFGTSTHQDYATVKYDPQGNQLWVARYNGPGNYADEAYALALDSQGNVYVTGYSYGSDTNEDFATVKYAPQGNQLWVSRYNGPGNWVDRAPCIIRGEKE